MKLYMRFHIFFVSLLLLVSCRNGNDNGAWAEPDLRFPYQAYFDSMGENEYFPMIGDDGHGFDAISDNIVYPELPDSLSLSHYADSLLQFYSIVLAFNTMAYDVSTAERYIGEPDFGLEQADALDSINLSGIKTPKIKDLIQIICKKGAATIRKGKKPNDQNFTEIEQFYDSFNQLSDPLYKAHLDDSEFDPSEIIPNYQEIHSKALSDTTTFRTEMMHKVLNETDFQKQCILARELAYTNYHSPQRDDRQMVAVIDKLLRSGKYSPLLGELWRMWRCMLQINILGSRSNDGAIYNLFYNQMKNRVALVYIAHMKTHYYDKIAFKEFARLTMTHNIVRNSGCMFGNNGNLEDMELFYSVFQEENEELENAD